MDWIKNNYPIILVIIISVCVILLLVHTLKKGNVDFSKFDIGHFINLGILFVLFLTLVFIVFYWHETHLMKIEMTKQNNISFQNTKVANAPFIDIEFEVVRSGPEFEHLQVQFAYDIFLVNRGNGPAFKIVVRRLIDRNQNQQRIALHPVQNRLGQFTKNIKVLGKGERFQLSREQSASYEWQKYDLMYWDIFKEQHTCEYEGDRDQLKLISYSGINRVD